MKRLFLIPIMIIGIFQLAISQENWRVKIAPKVLINYEESKNLDLLVRFKSQADLSPAKYIQSKKEKGRFVHQSLLSTAKTSQKIVQDWANAQHFQTQSFCVVNAMRVRIPAQFLKELALFDEVASISDNGLLKFHEPVEKYTTNLRGPNGIEWGIDMINANDVWALGYRGEGVVIGGEDTGYDWKHPALQAKYRGWDGSTADHNYNWHDAIHELNPLNGDTTNNPLNNPCGLNSQEPCDDGSHGTHTMGTMIGSTLDDTIGVAPGAKWIGVRNMERGWGMPSTYIEAFEWFIAPTNLNNENPDSDKSPDVINNSWGCPPIEGCDLSNFNIMNTVVANVKASGIVVVVSAGNSGSGCASVDDPAAIFEESFSIGATRDNDTIANFSSRGSVEIDGSNRTKPNVSAPGVGVRSSTPGGNYAFFSGTSMAGPHVAGAVGLILSAAPELKGQVDVVEDILEQTAVPKYSDQSCGGIEGTSVPNNTYGYGRIDVLKAVELALLTVSSQDLNPASTQLNVFPNPSKNTVYFDLKDFKGDIKVEIFDALGRTIYNNIESIEGNKLIRCELHDENQGMCFYKLTGQNLQLTGKFLKI